MPGTRSQLGLQCPERSSSRCRQEAQHTSKATSSEKPPYLSQEAAGPPSSSTPLGYIPPKTTMFTAVPMSPCTGFKAPQAQH